MISGILLAVAIMTSFGEVKVNCVDPGRWTFALESSGMSEGVETVRVTMKAEREMPPPKFSVGWFVTQRDTHHFWTGSSTHYGIPWDEPSVSELTSELPVYSFMGVNDENRFTFACSESCRRVVFHSPVDEVRQGFNCSFEFFSVSEAPIGSYEVEIRLDARKISYAQTIGDAADWIVRSAGIRPMAVPEEAFDALYSTWYTFHQDISSELVEEECSIAAELGLNSVIVDDGWQIDLPLGGRAWDGYRRCGDWKAGRNFPDMAAHIRRVHEMGLRYLLWYSVPFVGEESVNFSRFKGKLLPVNCAGGWVLDPRFPDVREFIVETYERAVRDWDLDGLKLDFIGRFTLKNGIVDPAIAENYAGRDLKSIPLAVDALLAMVKERLSVLKPNILIEFRQPYIGPSIRRFGNMLRASDCPLSMVENRTRIARIRLTAGKTAVHSDMLQWRNDETPENAALAILNSIFGVIQYSVRLKALPESHRRMMAHWIGFAAKHKEALVKGTFRPHLPASDYPLLEGEDETERVIGVYQKNLAISPGRADKPVYILNGTPGDRILMDVPVGYALVEIFDTFGALCGSESCSEAGLRSVSVPSAGYLKLTPAAGGDILVECERLSDVGGWTTDAQFIDQMGSPYLLAHGLGNPVAEAKGSFRFSQGGRRDVYVRTKNWTAFWARTGAAGRFRVAINGRELQETLGAQGNGDWQWVYAGAALLREGENTVSLHDLTGFDARCDAIALATGKRTPEELDRLAERERRKGDVAESQYDFVVVGGGIAGICAAVSAARSGLRTALVHNRPVLGGNNSSEVRVHLGAYANLPPYPRLGDVLAEIAPARGGNAQPASNYQDERKLAVVMNEKNLDLFLDTHVNEVCTNADGRIVFVRGVNVKTGRRTDFHADLFADTTGDGAVGVLAGADYRVGREARGEYGEPSAPEAADAMTMGASVQWYAERGEMSSFPTEPWMIAFDEKSVKPGLRGDWDWETGLGRDQVREAERIRDYGMLVVYSNWAYLKNRFSRKAEFSNAALSWVSFVAGKRESRRLLGDYILTECDLVNRNVQPDGTAAATWTIDQHYPWGKDHTGFSGEPFQAESRNILIWPYPIPYRCLYSRNVENLFMAGRNISVTHVALGTTRLMRTHGMLGEVIGMAAAVAKANGCSPREVLTRHWEKLSDRLRIGVGDGKVHPPQTYNCQESLDKEIRRKVEQKR